MQSKTIKIWGANKLVPHLLDHKNYVIDYRNLKFIVDLGINIDKVHKIISYDQKQWMKPYIEFTVDRRKEAKHEFEKDFLSLRITQSLVKHWRMLKIGLT